MLPDLPAHQRQAVADGTIKLTRTQSGLTQVGAARPQGPIFAAYSIPIALLLSYCMTQSTKVGQWELNSAYLKLTSKPIPRLFCAVREACGLRPVLEKHSVTNGQLPCNKNPGNSGVSL